MPLDADHHPLQRRAVVADERGLEQQVLGRVAGNHELGEGDEVGLLLARFVDAPQDDVGVAGDVADGGVHLREGQPKGAHQLVLLAMSYARILAQARDGGLEVVLLYRGSS